MYRIFKYPLATTDTQVIRAPQGGVPMCVQMQGRVPCMWLGVDDAQPVVDHTVRVIGTGHPIPDPERLHYVGTYQLDGGALVFHVFLVNAGVRPVRPEELKHG